MTIVKRILCLGAALGWQFASPAAELVQPAHAYSGIATRNAFGLQPIPEKPMAIAPAQDLPTISLKGFMTVFGRPQVVFTVVIKAPGAAALDSYYVLAEGESEDGIKVVQFDSLAGTVRFENQGKTQVLSFGAVAR